MPYPELEATLAALRLRTALYAMLARANQAAASSQSREQLFEETCRLAVELGQFRFAWVGVPGASGAVEPMARAGDDGGYLARVRISVTPGDVHATGPSGMALRTGDAFVVNDFAASPLTRPWREAARDVGFAASAALPLRQQGKVVAALTVYAGTPGFFTDELVETLAELTPSITLALDRFAADAEREARERDLRFRDRALQQMSQGVVIADARQPDLPMVFASASFTTLTGHPSDEVLGRNCRFLQGPNTDPRAVALVRDAIRAGRPAVVELLNYRRDGSTFWNQLSISPVHDADGTLTHFVGVQADVTERRRLEDQLRVAQRMEALGQLAGGVAHDFNNLLTVISGATELALMELAPEARGRDLLEESLRASQRASALTHQLLAFSRGQVVEARTFDPGTVLRDAARLLTRLIGEDVSLRATLSPGTAHVHMDPGQLHQVIINLAVNARDAMPRGGQLEITLANATPGERAAHAPTAPPGAYVCLSVRDTGVGMDPAVVARVFEPFFTTKAPGHGTGLGLSTVHGIVLKAGGRIGVESTPGAGTTFRVFLPQAVPDARTPAEEPMPVVRRGHERVLVVEDDPAVRVVVAHALRGEGYEVAEATNAAEALALLQAGAALDLIVSDVVLPGMGAAALGERAHALRPETRFLYLSGYSAREVERHGITVGSNAFLQKPFTRAALLAKVRQVLDA